MSRFEDRLKLLAPVPAAAAGLADWSSLHREQQRVGVVHAAANAGAMALFASSLLARTAGRHTQGRALALGGLAALTASTYLGRHLAFPLGAGASHAESVTHLARQASEHGMISRTVGEVCDMCVGNGGLPRFVHRYMPVESES